jgi:transposase
MTVKLHSLPTPIRNVLASAEHEAHLAYADALNHETTDYDETFARVHYAYTDMCEQLMVCYTYGCYERTDLGKYCNEHTKREVRGL